MFFKLFVLAAVLAFAAATAKPGYLAAAPYVGSYAAPALTYSTYSAPALNYGYGYGYGYAGRLAASPYYY